MSSQNLPSMQDSARELRTSGMDANQMYEEVRAIAGGSDATPLARGTQSRYIQYLGKVADPPRRPRHPESYNIHRGKGADRRAARGTQSRYNTGKVADPPRRSRHPELLLYPGIDPFWVLFFALSRISGIVTRFEYAESDAVCRSRWLHQY